MSLEHFDYADRITLTLCVISSPLETSESHVKIEDEEYGERVLSLQMIVATHNAKNVARKINEIMYLDGIDGHFFIDEKYHRAEVGASGVLYDIVLAVGSGVISSLATHIITNFRALRSYDEPEVEDRSCEAVAVVQANTRVPRKFIEVVEAKHSRNKSEYLLVDHLWNRSYYVALSQTISEYKIISKNTTISDAEKESLLQRLLDEVTFGDYVYEEEDLT